MYLSSLLEENITGLKEKTVYMICTLERKIATEKEELCENMVMKNIAII